MTRQVSSVGLFLLALLLLLSPQIKTIQGVTTDLFGEMSGYKGVAYATQSGSVSDYDKSFGANWESVRTFRLMQQLDTPIRVWVDKSSPLYKPHFNSYVTEGFRLWADALDSRLKYVFVNNPKQADITVTWVTSFNDRYVAGVTTYRVGSAKIQMKAVGVPDPDIKANVIHEIGHALGISGHSKNPEDIMVGVRRWTRSGFYEPKLSERDVQAIRRLYSTAWSKGEDLYTALEKNPPLSPPYIANKAGESQVKNVNTPVILLRQLPRPERYLQVFPSR
jgi:hypothetical protein